MGVTAQKGAVAIVTMEAVLVYSEFVRILVVEDDPKVASFIQSGLSRKDTPSTSCTMA